MFYIADQSYFQSTVYDDRLRACLRQTVLTYIRAMVCYPYSRWVAN